VIAQDVGDRGYSSSAAAAVVVGCVVRLRIQKLVMEVELVFVAADVLLLLGCPSRNNLEHLEVLDHVRTVSKVFDPSFLILDDYDVDGEYDHDGGFGGCRYYYCC